MSADLRAAAQQALEAWQRWLRGECPQWKLVMCFAELEAALAQQAEPVEPVAWMFESERNFNLVGYGGWEKRITEYRPNAPQGSVRNVTPLYAAPPQHPAKTVA